MQALNTQKAILQDQNKNPVVAVSQEPTCDYNLCEIQRQIYATITKFMEFQTKLVNLELPKEELLQKEQYFLKQLKELEEIMDKLLNPQTQITQFYNQSQDVENNKFLYIDQNQEILQNSSKKSNKKKNLDVQKEQLLMISQSPKKKQNLHLINSEKKNKQKNPGSNEKKPCIISLFKQSLSPDEIYNSPKQAQSQKLEENEQKQVQQQEQEKVEKEKDQSKIENQDQEQNQNTTQKIEKDDQKQENMEKLESNSQQKDEILEKQFDEQSYQSPVSKQAQKTEKLIQEQNQQQKEKQEQLQEQKDDENKQNEEEEYYSASQISPRKNLSDQELYEKNLQTEVQIQSQQIQNLGHNSQEKIKKQQKSGIKVNPVLIDTVNLSESIDELVTHKVDSQDQQIKEEITKLPVKNIDIISQIVEDNETKNNNDKQEKNTSQQKQKKLNQYLQDKYHKKQQEIQQQLDKDNDYNDSEEEEDDDEQQINYLKPGQPQKKVVYTDINKIGLEKNLEYALMNKCKKQFQDVADSQLQVINEMSKIKNNSNLFVQAYGGIGKTFAYVVGMFNKILKTQKKEDMIISNNKKNGQSSPLFIILALNDTLVTQIYYEIIQVSKGLNINWIRFYQIFGQNFLLEDQKQFRDNQPHIIVTTQQKLYQYDKQNAFSYDKLQGLIIDEADAILTFRDKRQNFALDKQLVLVDNIMQKSEKNCQLICLSQTLDESIKNIIKDHVQLDFKEISNGKNPMIPNCINCHGVFLPQLRDFQQIVNEKNKILSNILRRFDNKMSKVNSQNYLNGHLPKIMIFANSIERCQQITNFINSLQNYDRAVCITSDKNTEKEEKINIQRKLRKFREPNPILNILVTNDMFSRGLSIEGVRLVINYEMPYDPQQFIYRATRSSRNFYYGTCISLAEFNQHKYYVSVCNQFSIFGAFIQCVNQNYDLNNIKMHLEIDC